MPWKIRLGSIEPTVISDEAQTKVSTQPPLDAKETADKVHSQAEAGEEHVTRCGTNMDLIFLEEYKDQGTSSRFISLLV